jgi:alpha-1,2-mannosyltransferase
VAAAGVPGVVHPQGTAFPAGVAAAGSRVKGCVTADDPTDLIAMNVLSRDLDAGCRVWVDVTGLAFDPAGGYTGYVHMSRNRTWGRQLTCYLASGRATILARSAGDLRHRDLTKIHRLPVLASGGGITLRRVR